MNIPEEQRKLIKAIEEIKDINKLCEYLNTDYGKLYKTCTGYAIKARQ